jgi:hypothetical protein
VVSKRYSEQVMLEHLRVPSSWEEIEVGGTAWEYSASLAILSSHHRRHYLHPHKPLSTGRRQLAIARRVIFQCREL